MAAPLLAEAVGGTGFLGFIAAVAFATILAVVPGLTLSGRGGALARPVGERGARRPGPGRASSCAWRGSRRSLLGARSRSCWASPSRARTWPTWWGWRSRSRPAPTSPRCVLSIFWRALHHRAAPRPACWSAPRRPCVLIYLSPTIQVDDPEARRRRRSRCGTRPRHDPAVVPGRGSWSRCLFPEQAAWSASRRCEHRVHLGPEELAGPS